MNKKYLLHDLDSNLASKYFANLSTIEWVVIPADKPIAKCVGCFKCWLKTPGICTFRDGVELVGKAFLSCEQLLIVSENLYGGFSPKIKAFLDRTIPGVSPFFSKRNGELHHSARYNNTINLKAIFYNGYDVSSDEKEQAKHLVKAISINFFAEEHEVLFLECLDNLSEVKL